MNTIRKVLVRLDKFTDYFLMTCLGVMGSVLFLQVIFRYVLKSPLVWSEEAARYLHVWIALFGIRFGLKYNAHLNVSFFFNKFNKKTQSFIKLITDTFIIICIVLYLPGAVIFIKDQMNIVSSAMGVNMGMVYLPAFLGFLTAIFHLLGECVKSIIILKGGNAEEDEPSAGEAVKEVI